MDTTVYSRETLSRQSTFGALCVIPSSLSAEMLGRSGLDWLTIDCQHGLIDFGAMVSMLQAIAISPVLSLVRVPENNPATIGRALDAGAGGVIVPMVGSRAEAEAAVSAVRYAPDGARSWGATRAAWPGQVSTEPVEGLTFVMIETADAFEQAADIIATPGVDGVFVGTSDLAVSLGLGPQEHLHPRVREYATEVARLCRQNGVVAAISAPTPEIASAWHVAGFQMFSLGRDLTAMAERVTERLNAFRALAAHKG